MTIPNRFPSPNKTAQTQPHVQRALIAAALAMVVTQSACTPMEASGDDGEDPYDDAASAREMRSRRLEDIFGRVPGLSVTHGNTGRLMVRILGGPNMSGSSAPLFVVDGALMPTSSIDFLNPRAIVSVDVIKGPANTSVYGDQAKNGVVRITTLGARHNQ